jgi:predicted DNA-binding transcriptional regulator AlpA
MLWTLDRTCQEFAVDRSTLLRWIEDGIIPCPRILDGFVRFAEEDLYEWVRDGCPASEPSGLLFSKVRALDLLERVNVLGVQVANDERPDDPPEFKRRSRRLRKRVADIAEKTLKTEAEIRENILH